MTAIFQPLSSPNHWQPSPLAAGPFAGLQGGAVAGLLTAEIEAMANERGWGTPTSVSAWFLGPTPMSALRTQVSALTQGGRVSVIDNTLWPADGDQPCATVRVTLSKERAVEISGFAVPEQQAIDPTIYPVRTRRAMHGQPWFMDAMEVRAGDQVLWFKLNHPVVEGCGALSMVVGPADWTHGVGRPVENVVADPNPNLTVQLFRRPVGSWIGVRATTHWQPEAGLGMGRGNLLDVHGEIGCVSMSVVLMPFPGAGGRKPETKGSDAKANAAASPA